MPRVFVLGPATGRPRRASGDVATLDRGAGSVLPFFQAYVAELVDRLGNLLEGAEYVGAAVSGARDDLKLVAHPILEHELDPPKQLGVLSLLFPQHHPQQGSLNQQQARDRHLTRVCACLERHGSELTDDQGEDRRNKDLGLSPATASKKRGAAQHADKDRLDDHQEVPHARRPYRMNEGRFTERRARAACGAEIGQRSQWVGCSNKPEV